MHDPLLRLYHRLPAWGRSLAATTRGYYLSSWRYGPDTDRLVAEALERETWTPTEWDHWRRERLAHVLHRAATRVPYYRAQWSERRRKGDRSSWEELENWPVLEKETVRQRAQELVADDCSRRGMLAEQTSGTTGKPVQLWMSRRTVRAWYSLFEARCRRWHGLTRFDRWAILGGQLVTPFQARRPPFWVWNGGLNQLYMSSYHLAPDLIPHYLEALQRYRITYLLGYTSSLNALAQEALRRGWRLARMRVAIANAEPVFPYQRHAINTAFQCPVQETYGMSEIAAAASECGEGRLHEWPEVGWSEIAEDGELFATGLVNADMPLIRYRVGDRVALAREADPCSCGRALPIFGSIEGRVDDVLYTLDGRAVGRLDPLFKAELPVVEAQIVQESVNRVRLFYVPAEGFSGKIGSDIVRRIQDRLGPVEVVLERVAAVPRGKNGKFRAVVSLVSRDRAEGTSLAHRC